MLRQPQPRRQVLGQGNAVVTSMANGNRIAVPLRPGAWVPAGAGSRIRRHAASTAMAHRMALRERPYAMREIVFRLQPVGSPGAADHLRATAGSLPITIEAASLEELQHEARDALIQHFGPAHVAYRVRIRRDAPANQWLQHSQAAARPIPKKPGRFRAGPVRSGDAVVTGPNACCHADRDTEPRPGRA